MSGMFITFEGIDACGKSTQALRLVEALRRRGDTVVHTREPGGTELGQRIRHLFLHIDGIDIDPATEALLMAADRAHHVKQVIAPALARGEIVISERYVDSTMAYQGYGGQLSLDAIRSINAFATGGLEPAITFLLDVDPVLAAKRRGGPLDRVEGKDLEFYHRVRQGFLAIQKANPERVVLLDGAAPVDAIHRVILSELQKRQLLIIEGGSSR